MKIVSVISKINLDVAIDGTKCFLRRTKKSITEQNGITTFKVLTDRVSFKEVEEPVYTGTEILDELDQPTGEYEQEVDSDGNLVFKTETKLISHSVRDANGVGILTEDQVNAMAENLKPMIPADATETEKRYIQESQGLLYETISKSLYGCNELEVLDV